MTSSQRRCPNCDAVNMYARQCYNCGHDLGAPDSNLPAVSGADPLANPDAAARPSGWGTRIPSREEMEPQPEPDQADSGGARSGPRSGAIAGRISYVGVQQFQQRERGWSTLLAVVLAIGVAASATRLLLTTFLPYLALAVLAFFVLQWATRGYFGRAIGSMGRLFMFSRAFAPRPDPRMSPVLPFRVDTAEGQVVQCTIRGDLDGGIAATRRPDRVGWPDGPSIGRLRSVGSAEYGYRSDHGSPCSCARSNEPGRLCGCCRWRSSGPRSPSCRRIGPSTEPARPVGFQGSPRWRPPRVQRASVEMREPLYLVVAWEGRMNSVSRPNLTDG